MSTKKHIEFDIGTRTYRVTTRLNNTYDVHGFNALRDEVGIYTDVISGDKIFVAWSLLPVLRFTDASDEDSTQPSRHTQPMEPVKKPRRVLP